MTTIKTTVRNRRIDVPAPSELPDGTEVMLTIAESSENESLPPEEITRILTAMQNLEPLKIPEEVEADLNDWERKINQRGIEHGDASMDLFSLLMYAEGVLIKAQGCESSSYPG